MSFTSEQFSQAGVTSTHAHGQQRTADDPQLEKEGSHGAQPLSATTPELTDTEKHELIELVRRYKQSWFLRRRMIVKRVLKAYEFFKGNHFISFDPESFQWFDALQASFNLEESKNDDLSLYQFATNFYQMLGFAFVAALSAQVPKTRFLPENAEREEDIATAKAASQVQEIIERQNHIKSLHKQGLLFLWMSGSYFRHTRYIVDSDLAGTHKEPVIEMKKVAVLPGQEIEVPVITEHQEVPNGMVAMTLYSALMVDAAPYAKNLRETPILNVDE